MASATPPERLKAPLILTAIVILLIQDFHRQYFWKNLGELSSELNKFELIFSHFTPVDGVEKKIDEKYLASERFD
jgi:hypothetical protein